RHDRISVEIVTKTIVADKVGPGIADRPVEHAELRIIHSGHPCGSARMSDTVAFPCFRSPFAGSRHCPEAPDLLSRRLVKRAHKPAHAFTTAGCAVNYQVAPGKRRTSRFVVWMPARHLGTQ